MKKILITVAGFIFAASANAQTAEGMKAGTDTFKLMLGSAQQTTSFGLEYERRSGSFGAGGKILHSTKNTVVKKAESTTFGAQVSSHLYDQNDMDMYISAGIAITNMEDALNVANPTEPTSNETLFGPTLGIGALYTITPTWAVGIEYFTLYNWFSEKVSDQYGFSNAVLSFNF